MSLNKLLLPKKLSRAALLVMFAMLSTGIAQAVALGQARVHSALGQKLDAELEISAMSMAEAESLAIKLATPQMFSDAGLEYGPVQRSLRLSIDKRGERQLIRINSDIAINDPFLVLLIEVSAHGSRIVRQYALLLDPPLIDQEPRTTESQLLSVTPLSLTEVPANRPVTPLSNSSTTDVSVKQEERSEQIKKPQTRTVRRGDTLAKIAKDSVSQTATLEQALIAYWRANPRAFEGNNMHRMKTGSVLKVPNDEAIASMPIADARREIALQTVDFHRYRRVLAQSAAQPADQGGNSTPATSNDHGNRSRSGKVEVLDKHAQKAESADQLKLESPGIGSAVPLKGRSASATDKTSNAADSVKDAANNASDTANAHELEQIAREKALAEANSRISELEKNISQMQQLTVRHQALADIQQNSEAKSFESASSATAPKEAPAAVLAKKPDTARTRLPIAPAEDPSLIDRLIRLKDQLISDPFPVTGAIVVTSVGLLLLWLRSRLHKRSMPAAKVEPSAEAQSMFAQVGARNVDTSNSMFHSNFVPSVSQLDANEVDAIAEADVYIAYGRDEQAVEILLDALKHHPQRHALRVKLLEIYFARKDSSKFGAVAAELRVLTHGHGSEWAQAAQLGQQLDPGNLLYGGSSASNGKLAQRVSPPAPSAVLTAAFDMSMPSSSVSPADTLPESISVQPVAAASTTLAYSPSWSAPAELPISSSLRPPSQQPPIRPTVGLVRSDEGVFSASAVEDFGIKLEGLLDERRKEPGDGLSPAPLDISRSAAPSSNNDFQLAGLEPAAIAQPDMVALKTKIELAIACQEIGDREAARDLLTEVASTGHAELAGRAQSLLEQLA